MACFRSRRLAAGFFICSVVVLGACKKDENKAAESGGGASAASNKDLEVIPAESDVVLGVDLGQAQQSALFRDLVLPQLTKNADVQHVLDTLKTKCNIDPMASAKKLTAGIKMAGGTADVVGVLHGIEKSKALPCLDQVKDQLAERKLEVTKDGDVVVIKGEHGELGFTFTGDTTAVIVMGPKANKDGVLAAAQGKSTLRSSKEFNDMYGRLKTGHTLWYLIKGDTEMIAKNLERLNVRAKAIFGSANVTDGLELHGYMRVESEEQATNLVDLIKGQSGMFSSMAEKVEIDRDKTDVRTMVKMTQAQLKSVIGLAQSLTRGFR